MVAVATSFESLPLNYICSSTTTFRRPPASRRWEPFLPKQLMDETTPRLTGLRTRRPSSLFLCRPVMASLGGLLGGMFLKGTDTGESTRKLYSQNVSLINSFESKMSTLSDSELREKTSFFKERVRLGDSLDSLLPVCPPSFLFFLLLNLTLFIPPSCMLAFGFKIALRIVTLSLMV